MYLGAGFYCAKCVCIWCSNWDSNPTSHLFLQTGDITSRRHMPIRLIRSYLHTVKQLVNLTYHINLVQLVESNHYGNLECGANGPYPTLLHNLAYLTGVEPVYRRMITSVSNFPSSAYKMETAYTKGALMCRPLYPLAFALI